MLTKHVALLQHLNNDPTLNPLSRQGGKRLMPIRIELLPLGIDNLDPMPPQGLPQPTEHHLDPSSQPLAALTLSSLKCPLQIVHSINHLTSNLSFPPNLCSLNVPSNPLPIILKISLSPLSQLQILIPLPLSVSQQGIEVLF